MRWWNEAVAALGDITPGGVPMLAFLSLLATILVALLWYFWPHWLPWNWRLRTGDTRSRSRRGGGAGGHRFRVGALRWRWRWRLRWRRRRRRDEVDTEDRPADELPDLPAQVLTLTADELAAAGRYAEAVRARLRAMLRELIERDVIPQSPGWTVTELATAATNARPVLAAPLLAAVDIFSEIWYGLRPARTADDDAMRRHAAAVTRLLAESEPVGATAGSAASAPLNGRGGTP